LLFWMCQGLLIVCREEVGELRVDRKVFSTFLFNFEPKTFLALPAPFVPLGNVAAKTWGGSPGLYLFGYGATWLAMIVLLCLSAVDKAFASMAASMYFIFALSVAALRVATRVKLGISGDMVSDALACCFALPFAVGQLAAEDFSCPAAQGKPENVILGSTDAQEKEKEGVQI